MICCCRYLMKIPPRHWSKSRFTQDAKTNMLLNNMSEAFKSVIVEARHKPIVTVCNDIRICLMERWALNIMKVLVWEGSVLPKIKKWLDLESINTQNWLCRYIVSILYYMFGFFFFISSLKYVYLTFCLLLIYMHDDCSRHISQLDDKFTVNLASKKCACMKWMLPSIPCVHVITCMKHMNINLEEFIVDYLEYSTMKQYTSQ